MGSRAWRDWSRLAPETALSDFERGVPGAKRRCPDCGDIVHRVVAGERTIWVCHSCQGDFFDVEHQA